jgi:hypothetical protein
VACLVTTVGSTVSGRVPPVTADAVVIDEARPLRPVSSEREETLRHRNQSQHVTHPDACATVNQRQSYVTRQVSKTKITHVLDPLEACDRT